ncbi:rubredoxin [Synechococcus sp. UW179B]|uniref:rubredoxin n=1 Tax=Synechococcus sp. UW179B TaxID=2575516 RepID=UPI000E0F4E3A|nr:rubredoxin [Synechococcus sp. UW179B]
MSDEISPSAEVPAEVDPPAELSVAPETMAKEDEAPVSKESETTDPRTHRFECRSCGYVYDPNEGVKKLGIVVGTAFEDLDPIGFRCPVCRSRVGAFTDIGPRSKASGFEENLNFGLGVNRLTPGQKNVLIFGGLALGFAFFLSLYSLR